jgi:hypothetical protein
MSAQPENPFRQWWKAVCENPKPWCFFVVGLGMPFLNIMHLPSLMVGLVLVLGFVLCVIAPFFSYTSLPKRFLWAGLATLAYLVAFGLAFTIAMSDFN